MKWIKFNDVASTANVADTFYYVSVDSIKYVTTTATTVLFHIDGLDANTAQDNITITCASGYGGSLAAEIMNAAGHLSQGDHLLVDVNTGKSGTTISDISPNVV